MVIFLGPAAMIITKDLRASARARLRDAQALLQAKRFDGAFYLCGYALELAKARICRTLKWSGFPDSGQDFQGLQSLKTHNLGTLLRLSGIEDRIIGKHREDWYLALTWNPERRYQVVGSSTAWQATEMVECVKRLLEVL
jgi:hypothetical protein